MSDKPKIMACPACREEGSDTRGDNLAVYPSGKFVCIKFLDKDPNKKAHNRRIIELMPELGKPEERTDPISNRSSERPLQKAMGQEVARYSYQDEHGVEIYQVRRHDPKTFRPWKIVDGKAIPSLEGIPRLPYRLPELLRAEEVWIVEGEKDADTLASLGIAATTRAGGSLHVGSRIDAMVQRKVCRALW